MNKKGAAQFSQGMVLSRNQLKHIGCLKQVTMNSQGIHKHLNYLPQAGYCE
jgi:hypothetical protein